VVATHDSSIAVPKSKLVLYSQADAQSGQIHLLSDVEGCQLHLDKLEHSAELTILLPVDSCQKNLVGVKKHCAADEVLADLRSAFTNLELYHTIITLS
jgi:hypothetical protein